MVTEYFGDYREPTAEEREIDTMKRQLVEQLRAETARVRESFGPVVRMHGDETVGFVSYDEFHVSDRAVRDYAAEKKEAEAEFANNEKQRMLVGTALIAMFPISIFIGNFLPVLGLYSFFIGIFCISAYGITCVWTNDAADKLERVDLTRSIASARGRSRGAIDWLAVGKKGVAFLDDEKRPGYASFEQFDSVYADTSARKLGFKVITDGVSRGYTLRYPHTIDIPTTRACVEDSVADYLVDAIVSLKAKAA
jgi:hypothetical protein